MKKEIRILGIDDGPFERKSGKKALIVGVVFRGGTFIDGCLSGFVRVDGYDATKKLIKLVNETRHKDQLHSIMLKGIAVAGFNVIDINELSRETKLPVLVVMRRLPKMDEIKAVLGHLPNGRKRLAVIESAGKIHKIGELYCQMAGFTLEEAEKVLKISTTQGNIPEPLRVAHIIAGGIVSGESRGRA